MWVKDKWKRDNYESNGGVCWKAGSASGSKADAHQAPPNCPEDLDYHHRARRIAGGACCQHFVPALRVADVGETWLCDPEEIDVQEKIKKKELPNGSVPSRTGVSAVRLESLDVIADAHQARPSPPLLLQFLNTLGFTAHEMYEMWLTGCLWAIFNETKEASCNTLPALLTLHCDSDRVPELWLEDDNLILSAENSLSRVSKGVLAARSSVCRDVLAFPRPRRLRVAEVKAVKREQDAGEREETESDVTMDVCPVVVQEHKLPVTPIHSIVLGTPPPPEEISILDNLPPQRT
ncbi:hypothetical protein B0H19DRAFT_1080575 [Mycena capillaripes]|nr:hypothetical protein B0H19DRAFT_1080575 [Mycena capillaripes]